MSRVLWLLALASVLSACKSEGKQPTQVLLEVDAEPSVRARLAMLTIEIRGGASDDAPSAYSGEPSSELESPALPLQVALVPRAGDASRRYQVTVSAHDDSGALVAQARVISGYVPDAVRFARLVLEDACIGVSACSGSSDEPLTCRAGVCADPRADVRSFSDDRGAPSLIRARPIEPGEAPEGGDDPDAGVEDAEVEDVESDAGPRSDASQPRSDASAQGDCKLGMSQLPCRLGM